MNELKPPPISVQNKAAVEVLRVWAAPGGAQQVVLQPFWNDPGAWGLMLVDIAQHAANAYEASGHDRAEVLARIRALWDAEWNAPTSDAQQVPD